MQRRWPGDQGGGGQGDRTTMQGTPRIASNTGSWARGMDQMLSQSPEGTKPAHTLILDSGP